MQHAACGPGPSAIRLKLVVAHSVIPVASAVSARTRLCSCYTVVDATQWRPNACSSLPSLDKEVAGSPYLAAQGLQTCGLATELTLLCLNHVAAGHTFCCGNLPHH